MKPLIEATPHNEEKIEKMLLKHNKVKDELVGVFERLGKTNNGLNLNQTALDLPAILQKLKTELAPQKQKLKDW